MKLYHDRNKITKLFEAKNIKPSDYPHSAKSEPQELELEFEESIAQRTNIRRQQKSDEKN